mmetsp:Transcript_63794/g.74723  ORF Transcript_63794/g.74723 Transcript_63794/m.74723 type:complete len:386 (+) Transcript_63794:41-1198(+)|eukprot:CAMPEP_0194379230 /NCGR_PEP_ID=MMETSP0174-20130528/38685_1 /TAXON_ID=216777 /ORGANISM="Proboscia alata, Strain PI-D3" /LENGTH=385 /DNA_ID=CAMNT_0039161815 /DNA_START=48 /DNA_END=1205 /DNA_ORIENTATION=+
MMKIVAVLFAFFGMAEAACPSSCSGHGTCGIDEVCTCYPGWGMGGKLGGDCSDRFCHHELAWVDKPASTGITHQYKECANKGACDRETGECECYDGYEGQGCGRQSCPNECSGHGTCEYMKELTYGIVYNEYYDGSTNALSGLGTGGKVFTDHSWDTDRARACVCDPGWAGLTCMNRMCPVGNDIMDVIPSFDEFGSSGQVGFTGFGNEKAQVQKITLFDKDLANVNFAGNTFALQFTSKLNETFATQPISWSTTDATLAGYIESSLKLLPNKIIDDVDVSVDSTTDSAGVIIRVTFTGSSVQGKQHKLEVLQDKCDEGCTPRITGLTNIRTQSAVTLSKVEIEIVGSHNSFECGRRGKCDFKTGLCSCFDGYTGDTCNILTSLV